MPRTVKTAPADLRAVLYALGALDVPERIDMDRRRRSDPTLDRTIEQWEQRFAQLALAAQEVVPPAGLWDRIAAALDAPAADLRVVRFDRLAWEPWGLGLEVKVLTRDSGGEPESLLMRMQAGAVVPEHVHHRAEECLVIEGDLLHDGQRLGTGDFTVAQPGGTHAPMTTTTGGLLYVRYLSA